MKWLTLAMALFVVQLQPSVSVTPASGEAGGEFVVVGTGFPADARVKVLWDGANLGGAVRVGPDGSFEFSTVVPATAASGSRVVEAVSVGGGTASAAATFTVVQAPPTSTTTTSTSTTTTVTTSPPTTMVVPPTQAIAPAATVAPVTSALADPAPPGVPIADDAGPPVTASAVESSDPTVAPITPTPTEQSPPRADGGGLLLPVLMVLVAAASIAFLLGGRSRRKERPEPGIAARAAAADDAGGPRELPPVEASAVARHEQGWSRRMLEMDPGGELAGMVQVGERVFGWGRGTDSSGAEVSRVWTSSDALHWSSVSVLEGVRAPHAVPWRGGLLVAGVSGSDARVSTRWWWSADGAIWEDTDNGSEDALAGVSLGGATAGHGTLVGWGHGPGGPGLWFSGDAASWSRSGIDGAFDLVAPSPAGFVAFGRDPEHRRAIVARSADGESWTRSGEEARFLFDGASVATLTSIDEGMVAAGTDIMRGVAAVWVSDDGVAWHRVPLNEKPGTTIEFLVAVDDRLLAVGTDTGRRMSGRGTTVVWESTDVVSWHRVAAAEVFRSAAIDGVALVDGSLSACGTLFVERAAGRVDAVPVGWTSSPSLGPVVSDPLGVPA